MTSSATTNELELLESEYSNFLRDQINSLLEEERSKNKDLTQVDELSIAIDFCKNYLSDTCNNDNAKRTEVMAKLVELRLELLRVRVSYQMNIYCMDCLRIVWKRARWQSE